MENNEAVYRWYKLVGFREVMQEEVKYYHVLYEDWKCVEMEYTFS